VALWRWQIWFLQEAKSLENSFQNLVALEFYFNSAQFVVALRRCQICFLQEAPKLEKSGSKACGIDLLTILANL
jgi:hypothetical protein